MIIECDPTQTYLLQNINVQISLWKFRSTSIAIVTPWDIILLIMVGIVSMVSTEHEETPGLPFLAGPPR